MTVKTRITLLIVGAGLVSSLLFSVFVFYELIEQPFDLLDSVMQEEAYRAVGMVVKAQPEADPGSLDAISRAEDRFWIEIYDPDRRKLRFQSGLAKSVRLPAVAPGAGAVAHPVVVEAETAGIQSRIQNTTFRVRTFAIALDGRSFIVQIARPMDKLNEEIRELVFGILAGLVFSTLALVVLSRFVAGRILRPIGRMKALAQKISEKNLERRIPADEGGDEFNELARTINRMLDRLQHSFARQKEFLFDTSHELKTPLTTIRLSVDELFALEGENLPSPAKDNLLRLRHQVLRMERLVKGLLELSSLETLSGIDPQPVQVTELLSSLAGEYRFLAGPRNILIDTRLPRGLVIYGDGEKLSRAFSNILDNAVKYNMDGGRIELRGERSTAAISISVVNTGPALAEVEIPKLFDQFYRAEKSRSLHHGGSGLGLAIVKRIVELHGGQVRFDSRQGACNRITVTLPIRPGSALT